MTAQKILFVISNPFIGGTETFILSLCPRLEELGHKIDILNIWQNSLMKAPAIRKGLSYKELPGNHRKVGLGVILELIRAIKQGDYDMVLGFGLRVTIILRLTRFLSRPSILATGLRGIDKWRKWYHTYMDRMTRGLSDYYIANSQAVAERFISKEKYARRKTHVIYNGIALKEFNPNFQNYGGRNAFDSGKDKIIVSTVANFRHEKGYDFYAEVIERFLANFENVLFIWAGEGSLKTQLQEKLRKAAALDKVKMPGRINNVSELLACSDIFVLPSREEGMSRALLEAMAMALPCVATNVGGNAEVIESGESGFLAEFGDVDAFGSNIVRLIQEEELRRIIGANARSRVEQNFDMLKIAAQYSAFFQSVASGSRALSPIA